MDDYNLQTILGITVTAGQAGPPDLFGKRDGKELAEIIAKPPNEALERLLTKLSRYVPSDPAHPWRDSYVQACTHRFLQEVVLPDWIKNHPHPDCGGIRVDDWGRLLCRYINPNNGVQGPWENSVHYVYYAYNLYAAFLKYGITVKGFLVAFCSIELP
jgi:hypothetical protein